MKAIDLYTDQLLSVLSAAEAGRLWGYTARTIQNMVRGGRISGRKTFGGVWLVSYDSCLKALGDPKQHIDLKIYDKD